jgi:hypothetical protein
MIDDLTKIKIGKAIKACSHPEKMKAWIDDLESDKYAQAQGSLHDPDEEAYCCLGVGCLPLVEDSIVCWESGSLGAYLKIPTGSRDAESKEQWTDYPPCTEFSKHYGIEMLSEGGLVNGGNVNLHIPEELIEAKYRDGIEVQSSCLATELNDDYQFTFKEIAACLRYTYGIPYDAAS